MPITSELFLHRIIMTYELSVCFVGKKTENGDQLRQQEESASSLIQQACPSLQTSIWMFTFNLKLQVTSLARR